MVNGVTLLLAESTRQFAASDSIHCDSSSLVCLLGLVRVKLSSSKAVIGW